MEKENKIFLILAPNLTKIKSLLKMQIMLKMNSLSNNKNPKYICIINQWYNTLIIANIIPMSKGMLIFNRMTS